MRYVLRVHLFMRVYRVRNFGRAGETAGDTSIRTSMIACHPSVGDRNLLDAGGMCALSVNYSAMAKTLGMVCGPNPKRNTAGRLIGGTSDGVQAHRQSEGG